MKLPFMRIVCQTMRTVCQTVRIVCQTMRIVCQTVRIVCQTVRTVCRTVRTVCRTVSGICQTMSNLRGLVRSGDAPLLPDRLGRLEESPGSTIGGLFIRVSHYSAILHYVLLPPNPKMDKIP